MKKSFAILLTIICFAGAHAAYRVPPTRITFTAPANKEKTKFLYFSIYPDTYQSFEHRMENGILIEFLPIRETAGQFSEVISLHIFKKTSVSLEELLSQMKTSATVHLKPRNIFSYEEKIISENGTKYATIFQDMRAFDPLSAKLLPKKSEIAFLKVFSTGEEVAVLQHCLRYDTKNKKQKAAAIAKGEEFMARATIVSKKFLELPI